MAAKTLEQHWCDQPSEEWAKDYFQRVSLGSPLAKLQLLAHRHFYGALPAGYVGNMPSSAELNRSGEQGENFELRVNWLRAHESAKNQIITAPRLSWGAQAINTDSRSLADASRGATILEAEWKKGPWEQLALDAQLGAGIYGEEFIAVLWDGSAGPATYFEEPVDAVDALPGQPPTPEQPEGVPPTEAVDGKPGRLHYEGDVAGHLIPSWDAFCDPTAQSWRSSQWVSCRIQTDRFDLIAKYPAMREQLLKAESAPSVTARGPNSTTINATADSAKVMCHYFFHRRTPGLPEGLQVVALSNDCVLSFEPLERHCFEPPIHQFRGGALKGSPRGYTDFWEAMASQDLATDIQSSLATNIVSFGKQMVSAESGSDLPVDQIGNGPFILYRKPGSQPPTPLDLHAPSDGSFAHLDAIRSDQRMILGLNDVAMGEAPTGTPNAQAWALLATAGVTANNGGQRDFVAAVRAVGQSILACWKAKVTSKRKTSVVGLHGASVPKQEEWDGADLEPMGDVLVEIANPLAQTAAGRLQLEQLYSDRGFVQVPEQLEQLISTGTLKPLTQGLQDELIYIAWENEQLLKGGSPPVMLTDSHQMHIREHKVVTFSATARENPAIIEAANRHIQLHVEQAMQMNPMLAQLLGQSTPQPPAAPPGKGEPPSALKRPGFAGDAPEGVKLPSAPVNPATGAPVGDPTGLS